MKKFLFLLLITSHIPIKSVVFETERPAEYYQRPQRLPPFPIFDEPCDCLTQQEIKKLLDACYCIKDVTKLGQLLSSSDEPDIAALGKAIIKYLERKQP